MSEPKAPRNTNRDTLSNPSGFILDSLAHGTGPTIERQEAQGQASFVNSDTLPTDGLESMRAIIEAAGGKIGDRVTNDPLFTYVTLPPGWRKEPSPDHSMLSYLIDDKGRKRAGLFYKAAFYDRKADIHPECRYQVMGDYERSDAGYAYVRSAGVVVHTVGPIVPDQGRTKARYPHARENADWAYLASADARSEAEEQADTWLAEHYPDWKDPAAYWD